MKQFIIIISLLCCVLGFSQNNNATFKQANDLYNNGQYEEALIHYEKILKDGEHSANLYFNLGNTHYKLNHIAESIYNYEKGLLLEPANKDILNNLSFSQKMTVDAINPIPESGFSKIFNSLAGKFNFNTWGKIAIGFSILFVLSFIVYYFSYSTTKKRILFLTSALSLILMVVSVLIAFQQEMNGKNTIHAIVFSEEASVKTEPNRRSDESFRLHEGTKVKVLETVKEWKSIKLADGKTGWINSSEIKEL